MKKVFVTGATGHVGANLVRSLLADGKAVRALVRPRTDVAALDGLDLEQVEGDLRDRDAILRAVAGCDEIYHVAAHVSLRPGDEQEIYDSNVLGTRWVLDAAEKHGVRRTVHCSSFGAVGRNPNGGASDETISANPFEMHLAYEITKVIAELEVHRAVNRGLDVVIVNPCGIVGPHDYKPSSVGKTILDFANRKMPAYVPGQFEFVGVDDVVKGHRLAMEKGRTGERYILSSQLLTLDRILDHLHEVTGAPRPRIKIPPRVMLPIAHLTSAFMGRFFPSVPPRFTPGTIKVLHNGKIADWSKARRELGYNPVSPLDAFTDAVAWFAARGQIKNWKGSRSGVVSPRVDSASGAKTQNASVDGAA